MAHRASSALLTVILAKTLPSLPVGPQRDAADAFAGKMWVLGQEQESVLETEPDAHRSFSSLLII